MPDLQFQVEDVVATPNALTPQLSFKVRITNSEPDPVHSMALRVQVQIEPVRRRYTRSRAGASEGTVRRAGALEQDPATAAVDQRECQCLWFCGSTVIDVPVPCTFDFNIAVTKYIYGLENGELPVTLLFSGTVFLCRD